MCQYYSCRTEIIQTYSRRKTDRIKLKVLFIEMNHLYVGRSRSNNREINYLDTTCLIIMRFDVINFYSCYIFEMRKYLLIDRTSKTRLIEISPSRFRARLGFGSIQIQALLWLGFSSWSFASFECVAYLLRKPNHVYFHNTTPWNDK